MAVRQTVGPTAYARGRVGNATAPSSRGRLLARIESSEACVAVVGAGYVGLALAAGAAEAGFEVTCLDIDSERVRQLNQGHSYVDDLPDSVVRELRAQKRLEATTDSAALSRADVIVICVPTPLTPSKEPDLSAVRAATANVKEHLQPGSLVVLESTTYPGTTDEVLRPALESSGLRAGVDFWLAFSPERIDPGNRTHTLRKTPKVVGGVDDDSTQVAAAFYGKLVDSVVPVSCAMTAEMVKIYENVFRNINIAFANEMAQLCDRMGLDAWEVIEAAATKPFGFMPFYPGPGLGGHCIPIDPHYLSWKARQYDFEVKFVNLAADVNANMPHYVVSRVMRALNERGSSLKGSTILVLGAAYKPDVKDTRESPVFKVIPLLQKGGARVLYNDPYVPKLMIANGLGNSPIHLHSVPLANGVLASADCVLILTDHHCYDYEAILSEARLVVDTRNAVGRGNGLPDKVARL